jgi:hypothetical protein
MSIAWKIYEIEIASYKLAMAASHTSISFPFYQDIVVVQEGFIAQFQVGLNCTLVRSYPSSLPLDPLPAPCI